MRFTIDEALDKPGPVTFLKQETDVSVEHVAGILRDIASRIDLIAEGKDAPGRPVSFDNSGRQPETRLVVRSGSDPLSIPILWIETESYLHDPDKQMALLVKSALKAIEEYERHPLLQDLDDEAVAAVLIEDFFQSNPEAPRCTQTKQISPRSLFKGARVCTPNEPFLRAAPQWNRIFTVFELKQSNFRSGPTLSLDPLSLNESHPLQDIDPVTRLWATSKIDLFKNDPEPKP